MHRLNEARKVLIAREKKKQKVQHEFKAIKSKEAQQIRMQSNQESIRDIATNSRAFLRKMEVNEKGQYYDDSEKVARQSGDQGFHLLRKQLEDTRNRELIKPLPNSRYVKKGSGLLKSIMNLHEAYKLSP